MVDPPWPPFMPTEYSCNRQKKKDQIRRDNMVERFPAEVTVTGDDAGGMIFYCARQHQAVRSNSLNQPSPARELFYAADSK
jgi:hypothetical protein